MKKVTSLLFAVILIGALLCGCVPAEAYSSATASPSIRLTTQDLVEVTLSAPEGSGAIRTLTLHYKQDGEDKSATLDDISLLDIEGYDDEAKEQTFTSSDYDGDGIVDFIVYREFWFPDINASHTEILLWPTVYEYDLNSGFIIASAHHKKYFRAYIQMCDEQMNSGGADMTDATKLAMKRLIEAAGRIVSKTFVPQSPYNGQYYEDVYELTKDIQL